ncbi:AAA family ATPase [Marinicellulosiphila megalodicopiae]|uniref:AAA family ATPase n=1 Tax=Marinicellulosiphila megalodicopiae TaxID=2724896 RepID=UPI003BB0F6D6
MISEIQINPPVATYQEMAVLSDLRAINYIFGSNGTGKTTISRVIAQLMGHEHCQLIWNGGVQLETMVYNQDFVDSNFNQDGPLQGVFTLGENQVEAERKIAQLKPKIEKEEEKITSLNIQLDGDDGILGKRKELTDLEPVLKEKCWKQKELHDSYFEKAFAESSVRGNKERFKLKVLSEVEINTAELHDLETIKEKAQTVFLENATSESLLEELCADEIINTESNLILQKVIVGNQDVDIASLIERLGNSDWVKQGLKYHEQDTCPFCQQSTDQHFANNLSEFFSEAYDDDIQIIKNLQSNYQSAYDQLITDIQKNIDLNNTFLNSELFDSQVQLLRQSLKNNQDKLAKKLEEPSRKIELEKIEPILTKLQKFVTEANTATNTHNTTITNIKSEKQTLIAQIWSFILNELSADLKQYTNSKKRLDATISGMEKGLEDTERRLLLLQNQVKELEKQTTSIQPTIKAINDLLRKFGFHSFSLGETDESKHYRIIRSNGDDASHSLSEGEKTFISFLYFYYLIKGAQSSTGLTSSRIVVFDDPISSLDSDILYIVSSLIKGVMEEVRNKNSQIKQLFILTHNVYFHKEISFNQKRKPGNLLSEESFWQVKKTGEGSIVLRCETNPIQTAYELLWEDVASSNVSSINLQNTLRRILENYFTMWGGMKKDEICDLFDGREKIICQSLFSWTNDGSHSIHDDLYINQGTQTNEVYLQVFQDIFDKAGQIGHYNMMAGVVECIDEEIITELGI